MRDRFKPGETTDAIYSAIGEEKLNVLLAALDVADDIGDDLEDGAWQAIMHEHANAFFSRLSKTERAALRNNGDIYDGEDLFFAWLEQRGEKS